MYYQFQLRPFLSKEKFYKNKTLGLGKKFKNKIRTKPGLLSAEHKNKVSRVAISKIIGTEHQERASLSLILYYR